MHRKPSVGSFEPLETGSELRLTTIEYADCEGGMGREGKESAWTFPSFQAGGGTVKNVKC